MCNSCDDFTSDASEGAAMDCPACGGEGVLLGKLGSLAHYRCRACGVDFNNAGEHEAPTRRDPNVCGQSFVGVEVGRGRCARRLNHKGPCAGDAQAILRDACVPLGSDYDFLAASQVDALLAAARKLGYRKGTYANGSTGRYFHDYMQRVASHWVPF